LVAAGVGRRRRFLGEPETASNEKSHQLVSPRCALEIQKAAAPGLQVAISEENTIMEYQQYEQE
jgi:hypothetical protein